MPVLEFSSVLSDADLIEIVQISSAEKQTAVAKRASVSGELANALIDHGKVRHGGGDPGQQSRCRVEGRAIWRRPLPNSASADPVVNNSLVARANLPLRISEKDRRARLRSAARTSAVA